jgi:hypothetical protein
MTQQQLTTLNEFSHRGVCIDSTHNTTRYIFKLATLLVIDDYGRSRAVAHYFCSSESTDDMRRLFYHLKFRSAFCQCIMLIYLIDFRCKFAGCKVLLSDDTTVFRKAFVDYFGDIGTQLLLCLWHVLRNWKKNCQLKIND